MLNTFSRSLIR